MNEIIKANDKTGMRWYKVPGASSALPSVTAILHRYSPEGPGLARWKASTNNWEEVLRRSGIIGTLVHYRIACWFAEHFKLAPVELDLQGGGLSMDMIEQSNTVMSYFEDLIRERKFVPEAIEKTCWHRRAMYAGTIDYIGRFEGVRALVDWKTGSGVYPNYRAQAYAYKRALMSDPHFKGVIDQCVIIVINASRGLKVEVVDDEEAAGRMWWSAFDGFQVDQRPQAQWIRQGDL